MIHIIFGARGVWSGWQNREREASFSASKAVLRQPLSSSRSSAADRQMYCRIRCDLPVRQLGGRFIQPGQTSV